MRKGVLLALLCAALLDSCTSASATTAYAQPEPSAGSEREPTGRASNARQPPSMADARVSQLAPYPLSSSVSEPTAADRVEPSDAAQRVYLNGELLGEPDLRELEARLGQPPAPGRYWYDSKSGLWGLSGHGTGGVTKPELRAEPLADDASSATTGVLVNGRQITRTELLVLGRLLGWADPQARSYAGRYVLDQNGELYGPANRYLGNLVKAAARAKNVGVESHPDCVLWKLDGRDGVLGRAVTVACD